MRFSYKELPEAGGGWPRPLLAVEVADMDELSIPCLCDTGSINTLMPRWIADAAGVGLRGGDTVHLAMMGMTTQSVFTEVLLTAAGHTWEAPVGFCHPWPYGWGLLGQQSFFRYFTVEFRVYDFEFEVVPVTA